MKTVMLLLATSISLSALAADGVYDRRIEKIIKSQRIGKGMVYRNGRPVLKKERGCALTLANLATESFDRDALVISYEGRIIATNSYGITVHGHSVQGRAFWEAGVFYDPTTKETETRFPGGFAFQYATPDSTTLIAVTAQKIEMISRYRGNEIKSDCRFQ